MFVAVLALASCETTKAPAGPPPVDIEGASLSANSAVEIFERICIDQSPRFVQSIRVAASLGFQSIDGSGEYISAERNARLLVSGPDSPAGICNLTFLANRGDESYQNALRDIPRVSASKVRGLENSLLVDGNGQKTVIFAGLQQFKGTQLRSYVMLVGASAERFDR